MKYFTYLVYIIFWETLVFGGFGYVIFWMHASGWWALFALFLGGAAYSPMKWIHGVDK